MLRLICLLSALGQWAKGRVLEDGRHLMQKASHNSPWVVISRVTKVADGGAGNSKHEEWGIRLEIKGKLTDSSRLEALDKVKEEVEKELGEEYSRKARWAVNILHRSPEAGLEAIILWFPSADPDTLATTPPSPREFIFRLQSDQHISIFSLPSSPWTTGNQYSVRLVKHKLNEAYHVDRNTVISWMQLAAEGISFHIDQLDNVVKDLGETDGRESTMAMIRFLR